MNPFATIRELKKKLAAKEILPAEVLAFYKSRIEKYNPKLNAILEVFEPEASVEYSGHHQLSAIPGLVKDNICQKGHITSAGSKILANYVAPYEATIVKKLKAEGGILLGRTNCDEFAMGASGEFSAYGSTKNPWDLSRSPGGSSSGSAAAVAAGLVPWAIGSETGGSVRAPASFCNLVGLYPTYGLFSRYGLMAFGSSNDQVGPLTTNVYDNALVASAMSGHDAKDSTSLPEPKRDFTKKLDGKLPQNLTIGVIKDSLESDGVHSEIKVVFNETIQQLEQMGAQIKYIDMPNLKYGNSVYFVLSRAEAASNLSRFDGSLYGVRSSSSKSLNEMYVNTRDEGFGSEVKRRILMGNYVLCAGYRDAYYNKALQVRRLLRAEFEQAFADVDLLISPTQSMLPFKLGDESADPLAMYMSDYFTVPNNATGMPALSLPGGFSKDGLPIGFQFIGPRLSEELIYRTAYAYEQQTQHHLRHPAGYE